MQYKHICFVPPTKDATMSATSSSTIGCGNFYRILISELVKDLWTEAAVPQTAALEGSIHPSASKWPFFD